MAFFAGVVNVGRGEIGVGGFFLFHGMIGLLARRRRTAGIIGAIFIGHFMGVDLAGRLAVLHGLMSAIGLIGGRGFVVVEAAHAAFGLWLGPLITSAGIRNGIGHGNLHGNDRFDDNRRRAAN